MAITVYLLPYIEWISRKSLGLTWGVKSSTLFSLGNSRHYQANSDNALLVTAVARWDLLLTTAVGTLEWQEKIQAKTYVKLLEEYTDMSKKQRRPTKTDWRQRAVENHVDGIQPKLSASTKVKYYDNWWDPINWTQVAIITDRHRSSISTQL